MVVCGLALIFFMLYCNGFFSDCNCNNRGNSNAPRRVRFQRNEEIVQNRIFDGNAGVLSPPPYASAMEPSAPRLSVRGRTDSTLSIDSRYDNNQLVEDRQRMMESVRGDCNPGPVVERGRRMKDWVCSHHVPRGQPGHCSGYFRTPSEELPHSVQSR